MVILPHLSQIQAAHDPLDDGVVLRQPGDPRHLLGTAVQTLDEDGGLHLVIIIIIAVVL